MTRVEENRKVTDEILGMSGTEADFKSSLIMNTNMIVSLLIDISKSLAAIADDLSAKRDIEEQTRVSLEEIEKAYESIMDVAEGGYVDIEEIKVHFCKWLGMEDK